MWVTTSHQDIDERAQARGRQRVGPFGVHDHDQAAVNSCPSQRAAQKLHKLHLRVRVDHGGIDNLLSDGMSMPSESMLQKVRALALREGR